LLYPYGTLAAPGAEISAVLGLTLVGRSSPRPAGLRRGLAQSIPTLC
jgi:hypothetical protein